MEVMRRTMAGYATHVNFAGVIIIGLGCESSQIKDMMNAHGLSDGPMLHSFTIQEIGGTRHAIAGALSSSTKCRRRQTEYNGSRFQQQKSFWPLNVGSDSYSGISANPALGYAVDKLVQQGGTAILSETSEIYGAEHLLTRRAVSREVGENSSRVFIGGKIIVAVPGAR